MRANRVAPFIAAFWYLIVAATWILFSDWAVEAVISDVQTLTTVQAYKGWTFVVASSLLLAVLGVRQHRTRDRLEEERWRRERETRQAVEASEARFRSLIQNSSDIIRLLDREGAILYESPSITRVLGYEPGYRPGSGSLDRIHPDDRSRVRQELAEALESGHGHSTYRVKHANGEWRWFESVGVCMFDDPSVGAFVLNSRDITERKAADEALRDERSFSDAIISSLPGIFYVIDEEESYVRWNRNFARILDYEDDDLLRLRPGDLFEGEEKTLIEGKIREVFENGSATARAWVRTKNGDRIPYLLKGVRVSLGGRSYVAGIGIDMGDMYRARRDIEKLNEELGRSYAELRLAYDTTIEGWARALDLRDEETVGHSRRVTELTVQLAERVGIADEELVRIRWGALLHDIGKMGVPDEILLKPGKLSREEWVTMKRHTTYALELLSPIPFLRRALDIPYCHHERWDGTGYPCGLKGEQIPLAARLFSVVDVFDALTSDRPYRPAWTGERALGLIEKQAGSHFDPDVVDAFLKLQQENGLVAPGSSGSVVMASR